MRKRALVLGTAALAGVLLAGVVVTELTVTTPEKLADPVERELASEARARAYMCIDAPLAMLAVIASEVRSAKREAPESVAHPDAGGSQSSPSRPASLSPANRVGSGSNWGSVTGVVTAYSVFRLPLVRVDVRHAGTSTACDAQWFPRPAASHA